MNKRLFKTMTLLMSLVLIILATASCNDKGTGDGEIPKDGVVYKSSTNSGDYMYAMINDKVVYFNVFDPDNKYYACSNPLCKHNNDKCPAYCYSSQHLLIIDPEKKHYRLYICLVAMKALYIKMV